jgi:hypothetical protein
MEIEIRARLTNARVRFKARRRHMCRTHDACPKPTKRI